MSGALRNRKASKRQPSASDTETDTEVDGNDSGADEREVAEPVKEKPKGHSKGESKLSKLLTRLFFGTSLLGVLCSVIAAGHLATLGLVVFIQVMMFRELVNVRYSNREFKDLPLYRTTQWLWFGTSIFYTYGSSFFSEKYFPLIKSANVLRLLPFYELISLGLYSAMLVTTVLTLKKGYYKYQMGQLAWTITTIVITVVQVKSFTDNIFAGLFWFLFPVSLVICNDSMAYFVGMACGRKLIRRPFLSISPNKTWEGFIGGAPRSLRPAVLDRTSWRSTAVLRPPVLTPKTRTRTRAGQPFASLHTPWHAVICRCKPLHLPQAPSSPVSSRSYSRVYWSSSTFSSAPAKTSPPPSSS